MRSLKGRAFISQFPQWAVCLILDMWPGYYNVETAPRKTLLENDIFSQFCDQNLLAFCNVGEAHYNLIGKNTTINISTKKNYFLLRVHVVAKTLGSFAVESTTATIRETPPLTLCRCRACSPTLIWYRHCISVPLPPRNRSNPDTFAQILQECNIPS